MKIDGQTMKFRTPVYANEVLKNYPSMVLLESEEVKHFGIRAKPLEPQQELKPKRLYFLVELPKFPQENQKSPFRARSAIQMSAKERLETLMLARRSTSNLSIMKPTSIMTEERSPYHHKNNSKTENIVGPQARPVRMKLRLSKAEVEKLMMDSKDENEVAKKIMKLCMNNKNGRNGSLMEEQSHNNEGITKKGLKSREKRVGFLPTTEGEIQLAVAAS
ncbi:putative U3 small nucleolar RNA-associated protein 7-like isoform X1 [Capsicum annuum]|nr:putative U3 small nucleolar RNA-associated protein 7-like isoform X1 [Capsicum annuum]